MRFTMPDGCMGLRMQDGTAYGDRPGQSVEVTRPDHIAAIAASPNAGYIGSGKLAVSFADLLPDHRCACDFNALPWARRCPKCGAVLGPLA